MLFNSINYAIFLPVVFIIYWFITYKKPEFQNTVLFFASYFFYASWDWRFLFLLMFSTLLGYSTGQKIKEAKTQQTKKIWLWSSIVLNLGFLGIFKYYNFFIESISKAICNFGFNVNPYTISLILPVGISFYTFHGLSYIIDIYKGRITAEKNFVDYAVFMSFFPLLVAGPIERATHLLPQLKRQKNFDYSKAVDGLRQILWGLFKKIVIADKCAVFANEIFNNSSGLYGITLFLGAVFFTFQIYGDFSGYSDIALGSARLFGIELLQNFSFPYFSRDIAEFWRRWHISLSSWFKDYLYIPLGGSKGGNLIRIRNTLIIFIVSGFWHGANWTFIAWGALNAVFILPAIIMRSNRVNLDTVASGKLFPSIKEFLSMLITFTLSVFAWIFFRADHIGHAVQFISHMFKHPDSFFLVDYSKYTVIFLLILIFMIIEWIGREDKYAIAKIGLEWNRPLRYGMYYAILATILWFSGNEQTFIYFQF
jgi:alginate O-acetyltransferase complex protein AlgI